MSGQEYTFVFCFDVKTNKQRRRIANALEQQGVRVQKSVFEVVATSKQANKIYAGVESDLGLGDSLRMYCISAVGRRECRVTGGIDPIEEEGFLLL